MEVVGPVLAIVAAFGAIVAGLAWIASRARRKGVGGSVLGAVDEIFHPAAHQPRIEIARQAERKVGIPSAGDPAVPGEHPPPAH